MNRELRYQCQALARSGERCKCLADNFYMGQNLCNRHYWLMIKAKKEKK